MVSREHVLVGLEPDNLLAFLALMGLLRSLDHAEPGWKARAWWDGEPWRPRLRLDTEVSWDDIASAAARGCAELAAVHGLNGHSDLNFPAAIARELLEEAQNDRLRSDLLAALMSDAAQKDDGTIRATPLCAMFGQGHQHFLDRLASVPLHAEPAWNSPEKIVEALFQEWVRKDPTESFRWDPAEDRRYAHRFRNPSGDKGLTIHGANRLAAVGLPALTCVPLRTGQELRLAALCTRPGSRGRNLAIRWPIWIRPARLTGIRSLLGYVWQPSSQLATLGVIAVEECERISAGKYFSFTRARAVSS